MGSRPRRWRGPRVMTVQFDGVRTWPLGRPSGTGSRRPTLPFPGECDTGPDCETGATVAGIRGLRRRSRTERRRPWPRSPSARDRRTSAIASKANLHIIPHLRATESLLCEGGESRGFRRIATGPRRTGRFPRFAERFPSRIRIHRTPPVGRLRVSTKERGGVASFSRSSGGGSGLRRRVTRGGDHGHVSMVHESTLDHIRPPAAWNGHGTHSLSLRAGTEGSSLFSIISIELVCNNTYIH